MLSFDSSLNLANTDSPFMEHVLDVFKTVAGTEYSIVVDKENHVASVEGGNAILDKATKPAARWLEKHLTEERLSSGYEQVLGRFSEKKVKEGDTWEQAGYVNVFFVGQLFKVQRRYEYVGTEQLGGRTLDKIRWTDTGFVDKPDRKISASKGTLHFDPSLGLEVDSTHLLHFSHTIDADRRAELWIETTVHLKQGE